MKPGWVLVLTSPFALAACGTPRPTLEELARPLAEFGAEQTRSKGARFYVRDEERVVDAEGRSTSATGVRSACEGSTDCWWVHTRRGAGSVWIACFEALPPGAAPIGDCYDMSWKREDGEWRLVSATARPHWRRSGIDGHGWRIRIPALVRYPDGSPALPPPPPLPRVREPAQ